MHNYDKKKFSSAKINIRKFISLVLVFCMCIGNMPISVIAEDITGESIVNSIELTEETVDKNIIENNEDSASNPDSDNIDLTISDEESNVIDMVPEENSEENPENTTEENITEEIVLDENTESIVQNNSEEQNLEITSIPDDENDNPPANVLHSTNEEQEAYKNGEAPFLGVTITGEEDFTDVMSSQIKCLQGDERENVFASLQASFEDTDYELELPLWIGVVNTDGNELEPGHCRVEVEYADSSNLEGTALYHLKADNTWEKLPFEIHDKDGAKSFSFDVDSFSPFLFVRETEKEKAEESEESQESIEKEEIIEEEQEKIVDVTEPKTIDVEEDLSEENIIKEPEEKVVVEEEEEEAEEEKPVDVAENKEDIVSEEAEKIEETEEIMETGNTSSNKSNEDIDKENNTNNIFHKVKSAPNLLKAGNREHLTITKTIPQATGAETTQFSVRLWDEENETEHPIANYDIDVDGTTHTTDENGCVQVEIQTNAAEKGSIALTVPSHCHYSIEEVSCSLEGAKAISKTNEEGVMSEDITSEWVNEVVPFVVISKQDINGEEIAGASLTITGRETGADADITPITWTSGSDGHVDAEDETSALKPHTVQLKPGAYTLHEENAPDGYVIASDIDFTVEADGSVKVGTTIVEKIVMTDKPDTVPLTVAKVIPAAYRDVTANFKLKIWDDVDNTKVPHANFDVYTYVDEEKTLVGTTDENGEMTFELDVPASSRSKSIMLYVPYNCHYSVEETGCNVENCEFVYSNVTGVGASTNKVVERYAPDNKNAVQFYNYEKLPVPIKKIDAQGEFVPGAVLQILDDKGTVLKEWTTGDDAETVYLFPIINSTFLPEYYVLHEKTVPEGYIKADDIRFSVYPNDQTPGVPTIIPYQKTPVGTIEIVNYKPCNLTVKKEFDNSGTNVQVDHLAFGIQIRIENLPSGISGDGYDISETRIGSSYTDTKISHLDASRYVYSNSQTGTELMYFNVWLSPDEEFTIYDLPETATYSVTELQASNGDTPGTGQNNWYTVSYDENQTGTLDGNDVSTTVLNTLRTIDLKVKKTVHGYDDGRMFYFLFRAFKGANYLQLTEGDNVHTPVFTDRDGIERHFIYKGNYLYGLIPFRPEDGEQVIKLPFRVHWYCDEYVPKFGVDISEMSYDDIFNELTGPSTVSENDLHFTVHTAASESGYMSAYWSVTSGSNRSSDMYAYYDNLSRMIAFNKVDESGAGVSGAHMAIIEKDTDTVLKEWVSDGEPFVWNLRQAFGNNKINQMFDKEYILRETQAPDGYRQAEDIVFTLKKHEGTMPKYTEDGPGQVISYWYPYIDTGNGQETKELHMEDKSIYKDIDVDKYWDDEGYDSLRPESVTMNLYNASDLETVLASKTLTSADAVQGEPNHWHSVFKNLDRYNQTGDEIHYLIDEAPVEGYLKKYKPDGDIKGFYVTFTEDSAATGGLKFYTVSDGAFKHEIYYGEAPIISDRRPGYGFSGKTYFVPCEKGSYKFGVYAEYSSDISNVHIKSIVPTDEDPGGYTLRDCSYTPVSIASSWHSGPDYPEFELGKWTVYSWPNDFNLNYEGAAVHNESENCDLNITKIWDDAGHESNRPENITLKAFDVDGSEEPDGTKTVHTGSGTSQEIVFNNLKRDKTYKIEEEPVEGYKTLYDISDYSKIKALKVTFGNVKTSSNNLHLYTPNKNIYFGDASSLSDDEISGNTYYIPFQEGERPEFYIRLEGDGPYRECEVVNIEPVFNSEDIPNVTKYDIDHLNTNNIQDFSGDKYPKDYIVNSERTTFLHYVWGPQDHPFNGADIVINKYKEDIERQDLTIKKIYDDAGTGLDISPTHSYNYKDFYHHVPIRVLLTSDSPDGLDDVVVENGSGVLSKLHAYASTPESVDGYYQSMGSAEDNVIVPAHDIHSLTWCKKDGKYYAPYIFAVNPGEDIVIHGLPVGVQYDIKELLPGAPNPTVMIESHENTNGTIGLEPVPPAVITNTLKTCEYEVSKTIVGYDNGEQFFMQLNLSGLPNRYTGRLTFKDADGNEWKSISNPNGSGDSGNIDYGYILIPFRNGQTVKIKLPYDQPYMWTGNEYKINDNYNQDKSLETIKSIYDSGYSGYVHILSEVLEQVPLNMAQKNKPYTNFYNGNPSGSIYYNLYNPFVNVSSILPVSKIDNNGDPVVGAHMQILDSSDRSIVADWITDNDAYEWIPSEVTSWCRYNATRGTTEDSDTTYILHEVSAPEGYEPAEDIEFKIRMKVTDGSDYLSEEHRAQYSYYDTIGFPEFFVVIDGQEYKELRMEDRKLFTNIKVRKTWDDAGHEDKRPESVSFKIINDLNNTVASTITLSADDALDEKTWEKESERLSVENGETYHVEEEPVDGYTTLYDVSDYSKIKGFWVTLADDITTPAMIFYTLGTDKDKTSRIVFTSPTTSSSGYYAYAGNTYYIPNDDPENPGFVLFSGGAPNRLNTAITSIVPELETMSPNPVYSSVVNLEDKAVFDFSGDDLPCLNYPEEGNGNVYIRYTWGPQLTAFNSYNTIVNQYNVKQLDLTKTWDDEGHEGDRPDSFTVHVYNINDIEHPVDTITVDSAASGTYTQTFRSHEIPKYNADGSKAVYTIKEAPVPGYFSYNGDADELGVNMVVEDGSYIAYYRSMYIMRMGKGSIIPYNEPQNNSPDSSGTAPGYLKEGDFSGKTLHFNDNTFIEGNVQDIYDSWYYGVSNSYTKNRITFIGNEYPSMIGQFALYENESWEYKTHPESNISYLFRYRGDSWRGGAFNIANIYVPGSTSLVNRSIYKDTVNFPYKKIWDDNNDEKGIRPDSIRLSVYGDSYDDPLQTVTLDCTENEVSGEFTGLPKYDENGHEIKYRVVEEGVPAGYAPKYDLSGFPDAYMGLAVTFSDDTETSNLYYSEIHFRSWEYGMSVTSYDLQDNPVPSPTTSAYAGKTLVIPVKNSDKGFVLYLDKQKNAKIKVVDVHPVKTAVATSYTNQYGASEINSGQYDYFSGDNMPVLNHVGGSGSNYVLVYEWKGLSQSFDGANQITNRYSQTDVEFDKIWDDAGHESDRPSSITVGAYNINDMSAPVKTITLTAENAVAGEANHWKGVFKDLTKYDVNGKEIEYVVREAAVPNYITSYKGGENEEIAVKVSDSSVLPYECLFIYRHSDEDGWEQYKEPGATTGLRNAVIKYCDNLVMHFTDDHFVSCDSPEDRFWRVQGTDAKAIVECIGDNYPGYEGPFRMADEYYWKYKAAPDAKYTYYFLYDGDSWKGGSFTIDTISGIGKSVITNTHKEKNLIDVPYEKVWDDEGLEEYRPDSLTLKLHRDTDGAVVRQVSIGTQDDVTTGKFEGLPKYTDGYREIHYYIEEVVPENYTPTYDVIGGVGAEKTYNALAVTFSDDSYCAPYLMDKDTQYQSRHLGSSYEESDDSYYGSSLLYGKTIVVPIYAESNPGIIISKAFTDSSSDGAKIHVTDIKPAIVGEYGANDSKVKGAVYTDPSYNDLESVMILNETDKGYLNTSKAELAAIGKQYLNYTYTWTGSSTPFANGTKVTNTINLKKVNMRKIWEDGGNTSVRMPVTISAYNVLAPTTVVGTATAAPVTDSNEQTIGVVVPKYNADGSEAEYILKETPSDVYDELYDADDANGFLITFSSNLDMGSNNGGINIITSDKRCVYVDGETYSKGTALAGKSVFVPFGINGERLCYIYSAVDADAYGMKIDSIIPVKSNETVETTSWSVYNLTECSNKTFPESVHNPDKYTWQMFKYTMDTILVDHPYASANTVKNVLSPDKSIITFSKQDITGKEIAGAALKITGRADGASADITPIEWTSGSDGKEADGVTPKPHKAALLPGTYILEELSAPTGYLVAEKIRFTIASNGSITTSRPDGSGGWTSSNDSDGSTIVMVDDYAYRNLSISKTVTGNLGSRDKKFTFKVKLTKNSTPVTGTFEVTGITGTASVTANASGEATLQLSHGDTAVIHNIPYGTDYVVTENDYRSEGYTTTSQNASGRLTANKEASFTNNKNIMIQTGLDMNTKTFTLTAIISVLIAIALIFFRRKKRKAMLQ